MMIRAPRPALVCLAVASVALSSCSGGGSTSATPTTPTVTQASAPPAPVVKPALGTPVAVSPLNGSTVAARPQLVVSNAGRTGTVPGSVSYTFDVADNPNFSPVALSLPAGEGPEQTGVAVTSDLAAGRVYYWRATAVDAADGLTSSPSDTQQIRIANTNAGRIADQQGVVLWPGAFPTGTPGQARMGPGWGIGQQSSFDGVTFLSPPIEALRLFDLIDRGLDPDAAIRWLKGNGYPSQAVYYPEVLAIGLPYQYIALVGGSWELVHRVGA